MEKIELFFENWEFFREAALSGAISGALLGALGIYILLGRIVFLSAALAQTSSVGVALAIWLTALLGFSHENTPFLLDPVIFSMIFTIGILALISKGLRHTKSPDAALAALYLCGAAGTILIGTQIIHEIQDIQQLLTGNAVLVEHSDFMLLIIISILILGVFGYAHRGFEASTFWPDNSRVAGFPVTAFNLIKYAAITIAIAITTRMMGALPVFALTCLPAMAVRKAPNLRTMFYLAMIVGSFVGFAGYVIAFAADFPVGPTQAITALICVLLSLTISGIIGLIQKLRSKIRPESIAS